MSDPTPQSIEKFDRLKAILREMFQLDRGDLDFGLYRIMNLKAVEIEEFLDNDLLPQVKTALEGNTAGRLAELERELTQAHEQARGLGVDPETTPMVCDLRQRLYTAKADAAAETDVYNYLANFFARYYDEGDFMSLRRYSGGGRTTYLIPYDGEEVKLHWANADQYYIKSTENYASYVFTVGTGTEKRRVRFEISTADNEQDNVKETNGKQRRFLLAEGKDVETVELNGGDLIVRFEHRPLTKQEKKTCPGNGNKQQRHINEAARQRILKTLEPDWVALLAIAAPTENNPDRTVLDKHLAAYTAKNSFDYFIHKDLGGFLRRELDFYLKCDVLNMDDLALGDAARLNRALARTRAVRHVAEKIIAFLAQLEDYQKQLWLKKKFVLETQYCVTLDRVPETLYAEIAVNKAQREEWVKLFAIDAGNNEPTYSSPLPLREGQGEGAPYTNPLTVEFLKANPYLVLDTRHFDRDFTDKLLTALSNAGPLDEQLDGLLIHGENFQALNLLQTRYQGRVKCVYIDPPFNTGEEDFAYKDGYRSSSWLSAMSDRIALSRRLMSRDGQLVAHIDENEGENLHRLMDKIFGSDNYLGSMIWNKRNPKGDAKGLAIQHEAILWAVKDADILSSDEKDLRRPKRNAEKMLDVARKCVKTSSDLNEAGSKFSDWLKVQNFSGGELAYKFLDDTGRVFRTVSMAWPNKNKAPDEYFKPLIHPLTGKACPVPKRGWRNTPRKMKELLDEDLIVFGPDETTQPQRKYLLAENMFENVASVFDFGGSSDAESESIGVTFETMKPLALAKYICNFDSSGTVLDYFAGSGTTGHAVVGLNREDEGRRKYILVEVGHHFDTVLLLRLKKVVHSPDWKDGKPVSRKGITQFFKYIRLESYEDTLDSLELTPPDSAQQDLLAGNPVLAEDYRLRYALGEETTGSACLLGKHFADPFAYTLSAVRDGTRREVHVDLPETFNYLIGMRVESRRRMDGVLIITGTDAEGRNCLILWRNLHKTNNSTLSNWFTQHRENFKNPNIIYTNADHTLNALKRKNETWIAVTIEPIFRELMFKGEA